MQKDESIIKQILGSRIKVEKLYLLKHSGGSSIKIFTLKDDSTKYLLKSYTEQKYTDKETKNLDNINSIETFNKPQYFGKYKNFFIQEYINGILFQKLVDKLPSDQLRSYYLGAIKNLATIHFSKNHLKDRRLLCRLFEKKSLEKRLNIALAIIQEIGIPSYLRVTDKSNSKWNKFLKKVNISALVNDLSVQGNNYILGHGDYKPNNIIFTRDKKIFTIDWQGMSKAQPWYDLAYLLVHLNKTDKFAYLEYYLHTIKEKGNLLNVSMEKAKNLFRSGIIFQQIVRAKSNGHRIKSKKDKHHISEFEEALNGLVQIIEN